MRTSVSALGVLLLAIAGGHVACGGERATEEAPEARAAAEAPAASADAGSSAAPEPSEPVAAEDVVAYDGATHGAVEVNGVSATPVDWFEVLQNGERAVAGNPPLLNNAVELAPGTYVVDVNRTRRTVTVEAGRKTILWTGDLVVRGEPETAFWYPQQGDERTLSSNPPLLNRARALFPGTYTVFVEDYAGVAEGMMLRYELSASFRPVLPMGSPCDPEEIMNRCASGPCPMATRVCD